MPDVLVYQTSDPRFADSAVEALTRAGISSFRTGSGYADLRPGIRQDLASGVCIYIRRQEDYAHANEILRELGAAPDEPVKLPSRRVLFLLVLVATVLAILVATSCDALSPDTYWSSGDYELTAIDVKGQMMLAVNLHNGGSIGIVGPTVFSLGVDERYIVVKQHPAKDNFGNFDRGVTSYFVVTRLPGSAQDKEKGVRGPLSKDEFDQLSVSAHLPRFTKTFADLE